MAPPCPRIWTLLSPFIIFKFSFPISFHFLFWFLFVQWNSGVSYRYVPMNPFIPYNPCALCNPCVLYNPCVPCKSGVSYNPCVWWNPCILNNINVDFWSSCCVSSISKYSVGELMHAVYLKRLIVANISTLYLHKNQNNMRFNQIKESLQENIFLYSWLYFEKLSVKELQ